MLLNASIKGFRMSSFLTTITLKYMQAMILWKNGYLHIKKIIGKMVIFIYKKKNFLKENYIVIILNGLHGVKRIVIINEIFFYNC